MRFVTSVCCTVFLLMGLHAAAQMPDYEMALLFDKEAISKARVAGFSGVQTLHAGADTGIVAYGAFDEIGRLQTLTWLDNELGIKRSYTLLRGNCSIKRSNNLSHIKIQEPLLIKQRPLYY